MTEPYPLTNATLPQFSVATPRYDRSSLTPGILHIGVGNFHRAHQAWYLHQLMQMGQAQDWAILGAGVRSYDIAMREKLLAQDCLTTLIQLDPAQSSAEVIGPMIDYLPIEDGNGALISAMADPQIRIVSLTVTEGGYFQNPSTGTFDADHPDIQHDAAHPQTPKTAFGAMIEALRLRRAQGYAPFTALSCDNLQGNGAILRQVIVSLAQRIDPDLATWIDTHVSFPNSMVDCIAPSVGPEEVALAESFGIKDAAPVIHEPFRQWVIEDDFCNGRPDWAVVGATFSSDMHAYETMKIRILNAGHQVIIGAAELLSLATVAEAMTHPQIAALFHKVQSEHIAPLVPSVPDMATADYVALIAQRFANPKIKDTVRRVAFDGATRHAGFLLPILREALAEGHDIDGLALIEALWCRMCAGSREDGSDIAPNDPQWDRLHACAIAAKLRPAAWVEQSHVYGDLGQSAAFVGAFDRWLRLLWAEGTAATLAAYTGVEVSP